MQRVACCKRLVTRETRAGKVSLHAAKLGVEIAKTNSVLAAAASRAARLAHPLFPKKLRPKVQTFISRRCSRENPCSALQLSCSCGNWKFFSFSFCLGSVLHEGFPKARSILIIRIKFIITNIIVCLFNNDHHKHHHHHRRHHHHDHIEVEGPGRRPGLS